MYDDDTPRARFMLRSDAWGNAGHFYSTLAAVFCGCAGVVLLAGFTRRGLLAAAVVLAIGFVGLAWWLMAKGQRLSQIRPSDEMLVLETGINGVRMPGSTETLGWENVRSVTVHRGFGAHLRLDIAPAHPVSDHPVTDHPEHAGQPGGARARPVRRPRPVQVNLAPEQFGVGLEELVSAFAPFVPINDSDGGLGR